MGVQAVIDRVKSSHPYGAWSRYGEANGDLLAAGVAYFAFFSIFPALALAFAIFGFVLQGRPDLIDTIANSLNETLPGMVKTADNPTGVISLATPHTTTLTITGVVSFVALVLTGLGWISALRTGIRGVFGLDATPGNPIVAKLRDLGVLLTLGLAVAVSAILTSAVGGLAAHIAGWVGLGGHGVLLTLIGLALGVIFDTLIMVVLIRLLSGVPLPWSNVRNGAIVGAVLLTAMKYFGGVLIERAASNPLLGAVAVAVGLLFWLNLMSRVVLLSSAWAANDLDLARLAGEESESTVGGTGAPVPSPSTVQPYAAELVTRTQPGRVGDRRMLAAGVVLGAVGALTVGALRRERR